MIVGSVALVVVALVLLVFGVIRRDTTLLYASIVGSALAALALIVGVRQLPASNVPEANFDVRPSGPAGRRSRPVDAPTANAPAADPQAPADAHPTLSPDEALEGEHES